MYYVGFRPQLFNLSDDPEELRDVSTNSKYQNIVIDMERELRSLVDPEAIDAQAKADQRAIVERHGGREAVIGRGTYGYTPAPGEVPIYE